MLGVAPQDDTGAGEVVLVVEPARGGGYLYTCNGTVLDPQRVVSGVRPKLRAKDPEHTRMFVLFDHVISLDKMFEVASLFEGHEGLKNIRYFAFSRKTGVMQEVKPSWARWKLSLDGRLEKKPW
jgi:hypothetical protein